MRIASIDYGKSAGLAIGDVVSDKSNTLLVKYNLATIVDDIPTVLRFVQSAHCTSVILERRPENPSQIGIETYQSLYDGILKLRFAVIEGATLEDPHVLRLVYPGIWKPFMKTQSITYGTWAPETQHEKDAMRMLYYVVRIRKMEGEVSYD